MAATPLALQDERIIKALVPQNGYIGAIKLDDFAISLLIALLIAKLLLKSLRSGEKQQKEAFADEFRTLYADN
ncbi:hypothetical protein [Pseudovibrio ascidiaceicola]|uniref:hypothetical protein n=1 Tax=Pseudovibrio ascidiaceicola TaxID=285279 RepID=UPI00135A2CF5|nr:hypothetical protein [Pseudovibrio ascidiaceicola]